MTIVWFAFNSTLFGEVVLWADFDSWHHLWMRANLVGAHSSWVHICALEYRQLVMTCSYANLSRINTRHRTLLLFALQQQTTVVFIDFWSHQFLYKCSWILLQLRILEPTATWSWACPMGRGRCRRTCRPCHRPGGQLASKLICCH